jgi:hypothetical protein
VADDTTKKPARRPGRTADGRDLKTASRQGPDRGAAPMSSRRASAAAPDPVLNRDPVARAMPPGPEPIPQRPSNATRVTPATDPNRIAPEPFRVQNPLRGAGAPSGNVTGRVGIGGPLAQAGIVGAGLLADNVNRNYPRVRETEDQVSREEGISTRAFDAPARVPGRTPAMVAARGGSNGVPARDPAPSALLPEDQTGPRRGPADQPPAPARRPSPAPARPAARDERDNSADSLNRIELARIDRVKRGLEGDRPPQFAKGGMVAPKAAGNPFAKKAAAPAAKAPSFPFSKPSVTPASAPSRVGKAGRPAAPPAAPKPAPPKPAAKAPKLPALPFSKGGMPIKPKKK